MTPAPTYPFPESQLNLTVNYASRAAAAAAGIAVGPYNAAQPIKGWALPAGGVFSYFDPNSPATGYVGTMPPLSDADAAQINLPGAYTYPAYTVAPCPITWAGGSGDVSGFVCLKADAQAVMALIQPLYPKVTLSLAETDQGQFAFAYAAGELRREWAIEPLGKNAQELIAAMNAAGAGAPGSFALVTIEGFPNQLVWQAAPQVTIAPAGALTLPVPIRALNPGESIQPVTGVLPGSNAFQVVNTAAQLAYAQSQEQYWEAQVQTLEAAA
jgi:hypothetical protein